MSEMPELDDSLGPNLHGPGELAIERRERDRTFALRLGTRRKFVRADSAQDNDTTAQMRRNQTIDHLGFAGRI